MITKQCDTFRLTHLSASIRIVEYNLGQQIFHAIYRNPGWDPGFPVDPPGIVAQVRHATS